MDNFVIEKGWQENIYFKLYSVLYYTVHDTIQLTLCSHI
jgi:hypothetical protein